MGDSITTKSNLVNTVKALAIERPLGKITVSDVSTACGITRQAFYYHFNDKRALLSYLYKTDFADATQNAGLENWADRLGALLSIMEGQSEFYTVASRDDTDCLPLLLHEWFSGFLVNRFPAVAACAAWGYEQMLFTANFLSYGLCRTIIAWAQNGMEENAAALLSRVEVLGAPLLGPGRR